MNNSNSSSSTLCLIKFDDNPTKIYYEGQRVKGKSILSFKKTKNLLGIYITIEGKAHNEWIIGNGKTDLIYTGDEQYFSVMKYHLGDGNSIITIKPGTYTYTFQYDLPSTLPGSLQNENGCIRYYVIVSIKHPDKPVQEFSKTFYVRKTLNLNTMQNLQASDSRVKNITFYNFCCIGFCTETDPLQISVQLPFTGYVPGQQINVSIKIDNKSVDIHQFLMQIIKLIDFYSNNNNNYKKVREELIMAEKSIGGVPSNQLQVLNTDILVPEDVSATDVTSCNIIKTQYVLRITGLATVCCDEEAKLDIPITIGTYALASEEIPLRSLRVRPSMYQVILSRQPIPCAPEIIINNDTGINEKICNTATNSNNPPTYEEALNMP